MFRLARFRCLHVLLFRLNTLLLSVCYKDSLICFADSWKEKRDWCVRGHFRVMKFYNFLCYFFSFYTFFLPTTFTHTYGTHLRPTPTTHNHDPRPITHTHDFYPLPWVIFSHVKISCFRTKAHLIPVYITIIHDLSHTFFKRNYYEVKLHVKLALRFLQITAKHQDCPFFTVFLTIKTSSQNISITLLQISLQLHEHRGSYCWKKVP